MKGNKNNLMEDSSNLESELADAKPLIKDS
jgi:hypothetical protein